jgi:transposase
MQTMSTIGLDIAKSVFQVHGVDAAGQVVVRGQLKRRYVLTFFAKLPPCLVGIEACASSHYWSRELQALGHTVRLMPPAYVKPYVKRRRTTAPTRRRFAKRSPGQTCGSSRPRRLLREYRTTIISPFAPPRGGFSCASDHEPRGAQGLNLMPGTRH